MIRKKKGPAAMQVQEGQKQTGYVINSPACGRDKNGVMHCVCGKCRALTPAEDNHRGNRSDKRKDRFKFCQKIQNTMDGIPRLARHSSADGQKLAEAMKEVVM